MRKITAPLIFAGLAAAGYIFYRNFAGFTQTFTATVGKIKFNARQTQANAFLRAIFNVDIIVNNPSNFAGTIQAVKLNVILNDKVLGQVNQSVKISVPAQNKTILPVEIGVSTLNLYSNLSEAIKSLSEKKPLNFKIVGTVLTNYGTININEIATVNF